MTLMQQEILAGTARQKRLRELLLGYLVAATNCGPSAESMTQDDLLPSYVQAAVFGRVPDKQALHRAHPELATEIEVFFIVQAVNG